MIIMMTKAKKIIMIVIAKGSEGSKGRVYQVVRQETMR